MQIHELPAGTPAAGMAFAGDTGTQMQKIDYDALADAILNKLTTKTFDIESESQTIIAALNALGDAAKQGVANNLVTTGAGYVLDARQGKALSDLHATNANAIAALNSSTVKSKTVTGTTSAAGTLNLNMNPSSQPVVNVLCTDSGASYAAVITRSVGNQWVTIKRASDMINAQNLSITLTVFYVDL